MNLKLNNLEEINANLKKKIKSEMQNSKKNAKMFLETN